MATNQESLIEALRAVSSNTDDLGYTGEWLAVFDVDEIDPGTFNERMLSWLNAELVADEDEDAPYPTLMQAKEVYAQAAGFANWSSMNALL